MSEDRMIAERYEVLAEIGRGGMGLVARAFDHRLQTEVAIKVLRRDLTMGGAETESLIKEARVLARLTHPSVVRLFDLAETDFGLMLVLEYVRGPNLAQVLKARPRLTETELICIMRQICTGLDAAHAQGIVHRDLKPPNLLVAADAEAWESFQQGLCTSSLLLNAKVKITDFGISKLLATEGNGVAGADCTWASAGTPLFMSPEQFQGQVCTPATDIYALGVVAYQALSGALPFAGDSVEALAEKHLSIEPKPIDGCSPRINQAILRALAKAPGDRFPSAGAFLAALEGTDEAVGDLPTWEPDPLDCVEAWAKSHKVLLSLACTGLLALPVAALLFLTPTIASRTPIVRSTNTERVLPDFGRRLDLPVDLDVVPEVASLPLPSPPVAAERVRLGPRQPRLAWTALIDSDYEQTPWVDGVGPDGTAYVREETLNSLWAISDGLLRWGYRDSKQDGLVNPLIHRNSHADFRDPGRMWLAWCSEGRRNSCKGTVFNGSGSGGHTDRVPAGFGQPVTPADISVPFVENDAQSWRLPDTDARYFCTSRLGAVSLTDDARRWTAPIDGRAYIGIDRRGAGLIVSTVRGAVYALDKDGRIQWTYKATAAPENLQVMPSGDLMMLDKGRQTLSCIRIGKLRWRYKVGGGVTQFQDHVTGTWRFGVADTASTLYFLAENELSATLAIDRDGKLLWRLPWAEFVRGGGLTLDPHGRLFFTFQNYQMENRSRAGVICISEK